MKNLLALPLACLIALGASTVFGQSPPAPASPVLLPSFAPPVPTTEPSWASGPSDEPLIRLAEAPGLPAEDPLGIEAQEEAKSFLPPGTRPGVFQKANFVMSYMPRFEEDAVGVYGFKTNAVFGVPFPTRDQPLLITPQYRVLFLDGPDFTDVPPRVHEAQVGFSHFRKLSDRWLFNGGVTMGLYADDDSFDASDAFRVTGRALGIYELSQCWKGIVGVVYLNRAGLSVVPAAGLTYDRGDMKVDLIFPQPKIAWLLPGSQPRGMDQRWAYLMMELGGNIWAVKRESGADDTLSYGDYRLIAGYERKVIGGISSRWEIGYVFNRELEYDSEWYESELDDSMFVRAGWTY